MKAYTNVSRKTVGEDRVAICPIFGCEFMTRVRPLKLRFFGFGKYPKCKKHHIPLVYVDERIGDFVDAALACLFDKAGLPPSELLEGVESNFPDEVNSFLESWVYCITVGRGAPIISRYMDSISNAYLKQLTKKQIKALKEEGNSKPNQVNKTIKNGMDEITIHYTRILKHLRAHSEVFIDHQKLQSPSKKLQNFLKDWQINILKHNKIINSPKNKHEMALKEIKSYYDQILNVGTCRCLLGLNPESKETKKAKITAFERFSSYHEFYTEGLTMKFTKTDISMVKKSQKYTVPNNNINIHNFRERVLKYIEEIVNSIECTEKQKKIILSQSESILDKHISRAEMGEITIPQNTGIKANASAIIYAAIVSNEDMPKITGKRLSDLAGVSRTLVPTLYRKWYQGLAQRFTLNFQYAQIREAIKPLSLYFFELLLVNDIETANFVSNLKRIFLSQKKGNILELLSEKEIKWFKNMVENYSDTFFNYFSDLFNIIRLLIKSLKMHKIIKADFSVPDFARYLINNEDVNLLASDRTLISIIGDIFDYLKSTKYSSLFPSRTYLQENVQTYSLSSKQMSKVRRRIVGSRIKLYLMRCIYNGEYLLDNISQCPECIREGFLFNSSAPIIRAKEFHHEGKKEFSYTAENLFKLFNNNRGNPYFLQFLVNKAESEKIKLLCRCHHSLLKDSYFYIFKKLICWENIPSDFPQSLFDLPAEIIYTLIWICVDSYYDSRYIIDNQKKIDIRLEIIRLIKKKYIIDIIYNGKCPICGEFNTRKHLLAFTFNHLHMLKELTLEERTKERKLRKKNLYKLPCSEISKELERQIGGFICGNCHMFFHTDMQLVDKIYDDQKSSKIVKEGIENVHNKFNNNLIYSTKAIRDIFRLNFQMKRSFIDYFFTFSDILKENKVLNKNNIANKLGLSCSTVLAFFSKRKDILEKYGSIKKGIRDNPTEYYLNNYGITILRLIQYFKNYYSKSL